MGVLAYFSLGTFLVGFMSKEWMKIDSDGTFNGGLFGRSVGYATGSVTQVALTRFGYSY